MPRESGSNSVGVPYFSNSVFVKAVTVGSLLTGMYSVRLSDTIPSCPGIGPKNMVSTTPELSVAGDLMSIREPDIRVT
jgi:hypothetical protein